MHDIAAYSSFFHEASDVFPANPSLVVSLELRRDRASTSLCRWRGFRPPKMQTVAESLRRAVLSMRRLS
jgi:hypothetical protein